MGLYERIIGRDDAGNRIDRRIAPPLLSALAGEFVRGKITGEQAKTILELDDAEAADVLILLDTVQVLPTPVAKIGRVVEIEDVLFLARLQVPGYASPFEVRAKLGTAIPLPPPPE